MYKLFNMKNFSIVLPSQSQITYKNTIYIYLCAKIRRVCSRLWQKSWEKYRFVSKCSYDFCHQRYIQPLNPKQSQVYLLPFYENYLNLLSCYARKMFSDNWTYSHVSHTTKRSLYYTLHWEKLWENFVFSPEIFPFFCQNGRIIHPFWYKISHDFSQCMAYMSPAQSHFY